MTVGCLDDAMFVCYAVLPQSLEMAQKSQAAAERDLKLSKRDADRVLRELRQNVASLDSENARLLEENRLLHDQIKQLNSKAERADHDREKAVRTQERLQACYERLSAAEVEVASLRVRATEHQRDADRSKQLEQEAVATADAAERLHTENDKLRQQIAALEHQAEEQLAGGSLTHVRHCVAALLLSLMTSLCRVNSVVMPALMF